MLSIIETLLRYSLNIYYPNPPPFPGAVQLDGHFDIFVEWMPGGSIASLLDKFGPFNEKLLLNYSRQITLAVDYLHENKFVHRYTLRVSQEPTESGNTGP